MAKKKNWLLGLATLLFLGLSFAVFQTGLAEEGPLPPGISKQDSIPGKGKHKGWEKGKHKGWEKQAQKEEGANEKTEKGEKKEEKKETKEEKLKEKEAHTGQIEKEEHKGHEHSAVKSGVKTAP